MKISVPLINGLLPDQYGKYAPTADLLADHPVHSFPIDITEAPAATKAYALVFIDYDSTPVCGFTWIHWLATNLPVTWTQIPDDASRKLTDQFVQGNNSNAGSLVNGDPQITTGYVGPQPPDQNHDYTLTVYALDQELPLSEGFWLNEFLKAAQGHILAKAKLTIPSRA